MLQDATRRMDHGWPSHLLAGCPRCDGKVEGPWDSPSPLLASGKRLLVWVSRGTPAGQRSHRPGGLGPTWAWTHACAYAWSRQWHASVCLGASILLLHMHWYLYTDTHISDLSSESLLVQYSRSVSPSSPFQRQCGMLACGTQLLKNILMITRFMWVHVLFLERTR